MKSILISCLLCLFSQMMSAADVLTVNVKRNAPQFVITLPSNPTTGYQLKLKSYDKNSLQLINSQFIAPKTNRIGAGGVMEFTFKRTQTTPRPTSTQILFQYARPWEPTSGSDKPVVVNFIE